MESQAQRIAQALGKHKGSVTAHNRVLDAVLFLYKQVWYSSSCHTLKYKSESKSWKRPNSFLHLILH